MKSRPRGSRRVEAREFKIRMPTCGRMPSHGARNEDAKSPAFRNAHWAGPPGSKTVEVRVGFQGHLVRHFEPETEICGDLRRQSLEGFAVGNA